MERKEVIENSLKVMIRIASAITSVSQEIERLSHEDITEAEDWIIVGELAETLDSFLTVLSIRVKELQAHKLYDYKGESVDMDCPNCHSEMIEIEDDFVCPACNFIYGGEEDDS